MRNWNWIIAGAFGNTQGKEIEPDMAYRTSTTRYSACFKVKLEG